MARPRTFCDKKALQDALKVFWAKGYQAASLTDLTQAMGLSKSSFYETFGCKRQLFLKALDCYMQQGKQELADAFQGRTFRQGIAYVNQHFIEKAKQGCPEQGCFMFKVASDLACRDEEIKAKASQGFAQIVSVFQQAIERDQAAGILKPELNARAVAQFFVNQNAGLNIYAQVQPDQAGLQAMLNLGMSLLD